VQSPHTLMIRALTTCVGCLAIHSAYGYGIDVSDPAPIQATVGRTGRIEVKATNTGTTAPVGCGIAACRLLGMRAEYGNAGSATAGP